jgi:hypothetical protein
VTTRSDCYLGTDCRGPKYHVCLAGKPDTFPELLGEFPVKRQPKVYRSKGAGTTSPNQSQAQLDNLRLGNELRWAEKREADKERDAKLIKIYKEGGIGTASLAKKFRISRDTVLRVLREAQADGLLTMRPRGHTIANGAV